MPKRSVNARQTSKAFQCGPGGGKESISLDEHQIANEILEKQLKICGYKNDKEVIYLYLGENGLKDVPHLSRFRKLRNLWLNNNKIQYITFVKYNCYLTELYLHNNDIRNITGALKNLHSLQILLLHNNQLKNLNLTVKELQGLRTLHTLKITRKERESALHIYNHEKTLVLQSIGFGKRVDIPLLPKAALRLSPTKVLHLPPGFEFGNHLVKIPFANPEDAVFLRAMKRGMIEFSTVDWGKMPTCEEKRLGSSPEKRPEKLTIRFR
ncbi:leucine-rich repeat-containing protein 72 [Thamnophis elegans]|uniref:leucine-rich repeat-containing protein 72 n=1 Tax=Thamnophis elegans TaxID=35005 RepID=UPI0013779251|nr:leucine-rich repeat-containing protein 72 [Thamnophis elegans]